MIELDEISSCTTQWLHSVRSPVGKFPHPVSCSQLTSRVPPSLNTQARGMLTPITPATCPFYSYFTHLFHSPSISYVNLTEFFKYFYFCSFYRIFQFMSIQYHNLCSNSPMTDSWLFLFCTNGAAANILLLASLSTCARDSLE